MHYGPALPNQNQISSVSSSARARCASPAGISEMSPVWIVPGCPPLSISSLPLRITETSWCSWLECPSSGTQSPFCIRAVPIFRTAFCSAGKSSNDKTCSGCVAYSSRRSFMAVPFFAYGPPQNSKAQNRGGVLIVMACTSSLLSLRHM